MTPRHVVDVPSTPHFDFIYGAYRLSSWVIPYFATSMSLRQAADNLRLATDFPGAEMIRWRLEELYQRDIDWPRVERKIVPYLTSLDQPQFFNSLTIALLPQLPGGQLAQAFSVPEGDARWTPPKLDDPDRFKKVVEVGPVSCGYWESWERLTDPQARTGQLRWNTSQVFSVALDGQHRLAAIQQLCRVPGNPERLDRTYIPLILLLLDPRFGYEAPPDRQLVEVLRILFVDLNKHARSVSRARQILLDDKDPHSLCVRGLVGQQITDGVADLTDDPPRLPLSLIDWHTEQAKFDEGPYVSTILGLDWIVTEALGAKPIADYMDYRAIERQLKGFSKALGLELAEAQTRLQELRESKMQPFSYAEGPNGESEVVTIADAFESVWNGPITTLLTQFKPYAELINLRGKSGSLTVEFTNWYQLYDRRQDDKFAGRATQEYLQFIGRLAARQTNAISEAKLKDRLDELQVLKGESLAFNVVFQRAYFLGLLDFRLIAGSHIDELTQGLGEDFPSFDQADEDETTAAAEADDGESEEDESGSAERHSSTAGPALLAAHLQQRAREYVEALNRLVKAWPEFLNVDCIFADEDGKKRAFWLGTIRKPEGGIDFTQGASTRASEILLWVASMSLYDSILRPHSRADFEDLWAEIEGPEKHLSRRIARSVRRFADHSKESSAASRILRSQSRAISEHVCREEARVRMRHIWQMLQL